MRILIDARLYGLEHAGLGRYTKNLVDELVKLDLLGSYVILLKNKYFNQLKLPTNWKKIECDTKHYSLAEQFVLARIIYHEKPDLVHTPNNYVPVFSISPVVVTVHDLLMSKNRGLEATTLSPVSYFLKIFASKIVFRLGLVFSKKIIVPSIAVKDEIVNKYDISSSKISVIYEGATPLKISNFKFQISNYFVYVGNAYPHKNLTVLVKAATALRCAVVIATSRGVFEERLKKLIKKYKAEKYVKMLGFVSDDELGALYKNAIGFIYPSTYEGFGLQGLEVMSAGGLLLASDIPVFREIYKENAIYFNPNNVESLKNAMQKAMDLSLVKRKKTINKSQKFVKKYSWKNMAKQTLEVYNGAGGLYKMC